MGCSCIPPPASLKPRKTYNILVPDVFPLQAPRFEDPISQGVKRKIGKVEEYVDRNPGKIGKVSRRLSRRVKDALHKHQYGFVKVAVHTYVYLLAKSGEEDSKYTYSFFSKELLYQPDAIINTLLTYSKPEIKVLGAELLANYIKAQDEVDNQADALQPLVATVCSLALAAKEEELKVACLKSIQEYVIFCHKLKLLPNVLEDIENVVLSNLDLSSSKGSQILLQPSRTMDKNFAADMGISQSVPTGSGVPELAKSVLMQFKPFLQDVSTVYRVMETLFKYLDQGSKWQQTQLVENLMALVQRSGPDQQYPLLTALMRHSSAPNLPAQDRAMIIKLALQQDSVYSLSTYSIAVQELPKSMVALSPSPPEAAMLQQLVTEAITMLAKEVGDASQLCEAICSSLRSYSHATPLAQACLECSLVTAVAMQGLPTGFSGGTFPAPLFQQLSTIITTWGPSTRPTAVKLLTALLPCCGGSVKDDKQAMQVLSLVQQMASLNPGAPGDIVAMDSLVRFCTASKRPDVLLQVARLSRTVQVEGLQQASNTGPAPDNSQFGCALIVLTNSMLTQLAHVGSCPALLQAQRSVSVLGLEVSSTGVVARAPAFESASSAAATHSLEQLSQQSTADDWWSQVVGALSQTGVLQQEYKANLGPLLAEAFYARLKSGLPTSLAATATGAGAPDSVEGSAEAGKLVPPQLSSKLETMARSRLGSLRQERINLRNVLDILGDESSTGDGNSTTGTANGDPVAALDAGEVAVTVADVLQLTSKLPPAAPTSGAGQVQLADLAKQLEAVTG